MPHVASLRAFPPPLRFEVHPVALLRDGGRLEPWGPWMPAMGPCLLVLWRPGEEPAYEAAAGALVRRGAAWWFDPEEPVRQAWVVLWVPAEAPGAADEGI